MAPANFLKAIGSKKIDFYQLVTQSNYDGFTTGTSIVYRRYSEFQALRKALVHNGAQPLRLSWTEWIPGYMSRWEELCNWIEHLSRLKFNQGCLKELKKFLEDDSPYQPEKRRSGLYFI